MKYYKVESELKNAITVDTVSKNYGMSLSNTVHYQKLIQLVLAESAKSGLPLDCYFTLNNHIATQGQQYFSSIPAAVRSMHHMPTLTSHPDPKKGYINSQDLISFINQLLQNQVYLFQEGTYLWEHIFEESRKLKNPTLPSRAPSLFLFEKLSDCHNYIANSLGFGTICEVELLQTRELFRSDMNLMDNMQNFYSTHEALHASNEYWTAKPSATPLYEILFQGKCTISPI